MCECHTRFLKTPLWKLWGNHYGNSKKDVKNVLWKGNVHYGYFVKCCNISNNWVASTFFFIFLRKFFQVCIYEWLYSTFKVTQHAKVPKFREAVKHFTAKENDDIFKLLSFKLFTFFYVSRRKYWFRANFRFPVFDGFTRCGMS